VKRKLIISKNLNLERIEKVLKVNKSLKKIIAIIMLAIVLCSTINVQAFASYITDMNSNANFGVINNSLNEYGHELHYTIYDNSTYILFCSQYGETSPGGGIYAYNSDFEIQFNTQKQGYEKIAEYIYFGYTMKYGTGLPNSVEAKRAACSTQQFVWEYIRDNITSQYGAPRRDSWKSNYMSSSIYTKWLQETENYYNQYHNLNISFNGQTRKINLGEDNKITDTNGILSAYPTFTKEVEGVVFKHTQGSNDLVITVNSNCNVNSSKFNSSQYGIYKLTPTGNNYSAHEMSSYMYFNFTSGKVQNLIFSNYVKPISFDLKVEIQNAKILLKKVNNLGNSISGCKFELYTDLECTNKIAEGITANDGTILFERLKPGTYYIKEVEVTKGYLLDNSVKKVEVVSGKTATVEFKNNEPTGEIYIYKTNDRGDKVGGAEFTITAAENITNVAKTKTYFKKGDEVAKIVTDSKTGIASKTNLPLGEYLVKESKAPIGYLLNNKVFTAKLEYKNSITPVIQLKIEGVINIEPSGSLSIIKEDSETGSIPQGNAKLENAIYKVYANEDIYNIAKTKKLYTKGDEVATCKTNSKGETEAVHNLPLGKYMVKEIQAPTGYLIDKTEYEVELKYENQNTKIVTSSVTSKEKVKKMQVHIYKSGIKTNSGLVPGLKGAEFTIKLYADVQKAQNAGYTYAEIWNGINEKGQKVDVNSKRVADAQKIAPTYERIITDENGNAYTNKKLAYGKYIVKETKTPKDFYVSEDFTFSITEDESEVKEISKKVKHLYVNNEQKETYIKLVKKDADSGKIVSLNSTTFQIKATEDIYDRGNGKLIYKKDEIIKQKLGSIIYDSFTTNSKNVIVADRCYNNLKDDKGTVVMPLQLPVGKYQMIEIKTPLGYLKAESPVDFEIEGIKDYDKDNTGDYIKTIEIKNNKPYGTIIIDKSVSVKENVDTSFIDIKDLSKIKFRLSAKEDIIDVADGSIIYKKGQEIGVYNVDSKGSLEIQNLNMGIYELEEIETLEGLVLNKDKYEFKFTQQDTEIKEYILTRKIINETTLVEISKTDVTGEQELEGAKLSILDSKGNVIDTWTSTNKPHLIEGLKVGQKYTLKEDLAPIGFKIAKEIEFTVQNEVGTQHIKMIDESILKTVKIVKVDSETKEIIKADFKFAIYEDKECTKKIKEVASNKNEGTVLFEGLKFGEYYIKEIEAPNNYQLSDKIIKIKINENGVFADDELLEEDNSVCTITYYNNHNPVIYTGSNTNLLLLIGCTIISLTVIIVGIIILKRKK